MNYPENPNPYFTYFTETIDPSFDFDLSDYLVFDGHDHHGIDDPDSSSQSLASSEMIMGGVSGSSGATSKNSTTDIKCKKKNKEVERRVTFRTKSQLEVMDDGFKWRKYGKKTVKNSPNKRNYYKCSNGECNVKKRVERDKDDSSYVITSYDGVHNHESPSAVYFNQMLPNDWTLQFQSASPHSSSSS